MVKKLIYVINIVHYSLYLASLVILLFLQMPLGEWLILFFLTSIILALVSGVCAWITRKDVEVMNTCLVSIALNAANLAAVPIIIFLLISF